MLLPRPRWTTSVVCTSVIFAGLMGCCFNAAAPPPVPPAPPVVQQQGDNQPIKPDGEMSAGRKVFEANGCAKCHRIAGVTTGKTMGKAPELTTVGAKRDRAWIIEHVRDPHTHTKKTSMPRYEGKIDDADMQALGDYLASLK
jgi:mono/diheme cytochrome c family protein